MRLRRCFTKNADTYNETGGKTKGYVKWEVTRGSTWKQENYGLAFTFEVDSVHNFSSAYTLTKTSMS